MRGAHVRDTMNATPCGALRQLQRSVDKLTETLAGLREQVDWYVNYVNPEGSTDSVMTMCEYCHRLNTHSALQLKLPDVPATPPAPASLHPRPSSA